MGVGINLRTCVSFEFNFLQQVFHNQTLAALEDFNLPACRLVSRQLGISAEFEHHLGDVPITSNFVLAGCKSSLSVDPALKNSHSSLTWFKFTFRRVKPSGENSWRNPSAADKLLGDVI